MMTDGRRLDVSRKRSSSAGSKKMESGGGR